MPILPARLQQNSFQENGKSSIFPVSRQIIPQVEHHCMQGEPLGQHSWKTQGYIYLEESLCSILYQPPNTGNDLNAR